MRNHVPVVINQFKGLWERGGIDAVPLDHFSDCNNLVFKHKGFKTRPGIDVYDIAGATLPNIIRAYNYVHQNQEGLLVLDDQGNIYHTANPIDPFDPILTIATMTDFAYVNIAGRAYISPHDGAIGLENEFVYVYNGEGVAARKAAGAAPTGGTFAAAAGAAGHVEAGIHIFGVIYQTDSGFLTQIGAVKANITAAGNTKVNLTNINISPSSAVVARYIVATKAIDPTDYTGNQEGYQFFFVPDGRIADNTTAILTVDFYDAELLEDASHLLDLYDEIPAGAILSTFHNRLVVGAIFGESDPDPEDDTSGLMSSCYISYPGEPEAIDQVSGIIVAPLDGRPLTNAVEYRDVLYLFKQSRTFSCTDNGEDPTSWPVIVLDNGTGCSIHGMATVLDSNGVNVDYLMVCDFSGVMLFNGAYIRPEGEITWKIFDRWTAIDQDDFNQIQIINDSILKRLYLAMPDWTILFADYSEGLDREQIKWCPWEFQQKVNTIAFLNVNQLIIGSSGVMP
jgi:hypothetical protein